ncbi:right-handed parallel beta-helix repeat-containing protein [Bacillus anthracis]|nr:right-handed parallel beta-helix repeat-containing protein [Bacillus anthracis]MEC1957236.1 right-handed parallel beta-helix repeat-containing protein [Bacillus anthracis]
MFWFFYNHLSYLQCISSITKLQREKLKIKGYSHFGYLKCHKPCGYLVALRIQPHFHPMPKGDGLSRSGRTVIYKNDTKDQESGQIELNYDTRNNVITNNQIYASNSRIFISNNFNKNTGNKLDYNQYYGEFNQNNGLWQWKRKKYKGFSPYQASMMQEGNEQYSVFSKISPSFKLITK